VFKENKITAIVKDSSAARNGLLIDHHMVEVNGQNVIGLKVKTKLKVLKGHFTPFDKMKHQPTITQHLVMSLIVSYHWLTATQRWLISCPVTSGNFLTQLSC